MATKAEKEAFFKKYVPLAQEEQRRTGIPASVTLSQLIIETGWADSLLATKYNNLFGVKKGGSWTGPTVSLWDRQEGSYSPYRIYESELASIQDHSKVLMYSRYDKARQYANDPYKMVAEIHKAGYATDPLYTQKLQGALRDYNLTQYDVEGATYVPKPSTNSGSGSSGSSAGRPGNNLSNTSTGGSIGTIGSSSTGKPELNFETVLWAIVGILLVGAGLFVAFNPGVSNVAQIAKAVTK